MRKKHGLSAEEWKLTNLELKKNSFKNNGLIFLNLFNNCLLCG